MNALVYTAVTIALTAASQLLQKSVALRYEKQTNALAFYLRDKYFWLALALLAGAMSTWLCALTALEVSKAYALLSVNYLIVPLAAVALFGEKMSLRNWLGALILCAGALLIGHS